MSDNLLELKNITMKFGGVTALNEVNLHVKKGEIEEDLIKIGFESTYIYQPSMLIGARDESRPTELIFQKSFLYYL